jgi:hypothetical protein
MIKEKNFLRITRKNTKEFEYKFICDFCGIEFIKVGSEAVLKNKRFHSRSCIGKWIRKNRLTSLVISTGLKRFYSENDVWNKNKTKESCVGVKNISNSIIKRWDDPKFKEEKIKSSNFFNDKSGSKNPFFGKTHSIENREKFSKKRTEAIANGTYNFYSNLRGFKGWYFSDKMNENFYHDSFWELLRMKILDLDKTVIFWTKKHKIRIHYKINNIVKNYVPDFLITYKNKIVLEEVKGGCEKLEIKNIKFRILIEYCKINNLYSNIIEGEEMERLCNLFFHKKIRKLREEYKDDAKKHISDRSRGLYR